MKNREQVRKIKKKRIFRILYLKDISKYYYILYMFHIKDASSSTSLKLP